MPHATGSLNRNRERARRAVAAAVGLALLGGCSAGGDGEDPAPTATPTVVESPSAASGTAGGDIQVFVGDGTPLEPGRYASAVFDPSFSFAVGEGWEGGHDNPEFFDVWHGDDLSVGFGHPTSVASASGDVDVDVLASPRAALLAMSEVTDAGAVSRTRVDGRPAFEMRFSVPEPTAVFAGPTGELTIEPDWDVRAIALDDGGRLVLVTVQTQRADTGGLDDEVIGSIDLDTSI